tara:strand:+ start:63 stop:1481 length:1419 start_codon:yes stop_codon:yes gene_type:complete
MSDENQIIEDVEEVDLVENQELVQDIPEEVAEDTSQTLTQAVVDALLGEAKKNESEEESDDDSKDDEEEMEEAKAKTEEESEEESDDDSKDDEEEVEEAKAKTEEEDPEEEEEESAEEDEEAEESADDSDEVEEVSLPGVKTKAGYLAASFDALKGMKKSQLVSAYKGINVSEDEGEVEVPKTKADIINAMYGQLKAMKKDQLTASYKAIQDSCGGMHEELETESYAEDLKVLADSEQELTEGFKAKVATLFEGAIANRVVEIKESLEAQYDNDLQEEVGYIRESLVTKIDDYLSYVVETWIEENQEFVDNKLRTDITENFMKALQGVFTEHYIEVPDSKVDLVDQLSEEVASVKESLVDVEEKNVTLAEELESLHREKILSDATTDLASTQVAKLSSLIEEVDFVDADTFASKVAVIKEGFFSDSDSKEEEVITESSDSTNVKTIVEGETDPNSKLSGDMQRYISTLSRFK